VKGIYIGTICIQASMLIFYIWFLRRQKRLVFSSFSFPFLFEASVGLSGDFSKWTYSTGAFHGRSGEYKSPFPKGLKSL